MGHILLKLLNWAALLLLLLAGAAPAHADTDHAVSVGSAIVEVKAAASAASHFEAPAAPTEPAVHCGAPLLGLLAPASFTTRPACRLVYQPADGWSVSPQPPGFDPPPPRSPLTS